MATIRLPYKNTSIEALLIKKEKAFRCTMG
jgi:hypothetical protein